MSTASLDNGHRYQGVADVMPRPAAVATVRELDRVIGPHLRLMEHRAPDARSAGVVSYNERLAKTLRNSTALLNGRSAAARAAREANLLSLMRSASTRILAERLSGQRLGRIAGCQVIRYAPGDYVGPHHDAHPDASNLRRGYVDLHLSLATQGVMHQWLVYEKDGHLTEAVDMSPASAVTVSYLPFWHYVTPLVPRPGCASSAFRWLLLVSFELAG